MPELSLKLKLKLIRRVNEDFKGVSVPNTKENEEISKDLKQAGEKSRGICQENEKAGPKKR